MLYDFSDKHSVAFDLGILYCYILCVTLFTVYSYYKCNAYISKKNVISGIPELIIFLTGYSLKSAEAFTIFSVFNAMQFTVGVLPFTIRSIAEAKISLSRIQVRETVC